ncbi:hypothetical protein KUCAC02_022280 [Chaenocephalus aceratus]|nr:hypothetical protein KUCAC02_022280 [Chaenocephalus aceratus]
MLALVIRLEEQQLYKSRRSETQRATPELHLKDQDFQNQNFNRSFSCPRPPGLPGPPDGESPLLSPHGPAAPSGSLL